MGNQTCRHGQIPSKCRDCLEISQLKEALEESQSMTTGLITVVADLVKQLDESRAEVETLKRRLSDSQA